jgi:hypothetical protein
VQTQLGYQIIIARAMEASRSLHVLGGRLLPPSIRTYAPLGKVPGRPGHGLHKAIQRGFEIANGLLSLAMLDRLLDAVFDVVFQDGFADLVEPGTDCCNLRQHVIALPPFIPQPFEAVGVTGDARKPFGDVFA